MPKKVLSIGVILVCLALVAFQLFDFSEGNNDGKKYVAFDKTLTTAPVKGETLPPLKFIKTFRSPKYEPEEMTIDGKPLVLFFWVPGNEGCRHAINLMNSLAAIFTHEDVLFIGATHFNEGLVRVALSKQPIEGWVALDHDGSIMEGLDVDPLPHLVLVNRKGTIVAAGDPRDLTASMIRSLMADQRIDLPEKKEPPAPPRPPPDPLFEALVAPTRSVEPGFKMSWQYDTGHIYGDAVPAPLLVAEAYKMRAPRLIHADWLPKNRLYRFSVRHPSKDEDTMHELLQRAVCDAFKIECSFVSVECDVVRLRRLSGAAEPSEHSGGKPRGVALNPNTKGESTIHKARPNRKGAMGVSPMGFLDYRSVTMSGFVRSLEENLSLPVINETELTGEYDIHLSIDPRDPDTLIKSLADIGMELVEDKGQMRSLKIERRND